MKVEQSLEEIKQVFESRNAEYKDSYKDFGKLFYAMFPSLTIDTVEDANRLGILVQIVSKLVRYRANFKQPHNPDHMKDIAVYALLLEELDGEKRSS